MGAPFHNLPSQPTPLIGRTRDVATAHDALARDDVRLLTVTGPAGVGKTRLALATAANALPAFQDGAWLVDLAALDDPAQLPAAVGRVLGLREARAIPLIDSLRQHLVKQQALLLLDNFEHLLPAAPVVGALLADCPRLKVLVTSRAPLRLRWEHELPLAPLALPDPAATSDHPALVEAPAVALFVARARTVEPGFALDGTNARPVADLCTHLDGLPLAIELAAARIRVLSPRAMLGRLTGASSTTSLDLLAPGALDMPARHQTLRAAIGWSHDLLSPEHRVLFRRLSVFAGGCTLEMVEHVCGSPARATGETSLGAMLENLGTLVESHLLERTLAPDGEPRFRMLATIREYAAEQLAASEEADRIRRRHALCMMALAEQMERALGGPREAESLDLLEREYDNLQAALAYLSLSAHVEAGLRASKALWRFWSVRGHLSDGRAWIAALLDRDREAGAKSPARSLALSAAGWMALEQDDIAAARAHCEEGLALARARGDDEPVAEFLSQLGHTARQKGDFVSAEAYYREGLALRRARGDRLGVAWSLRNVAHVARLRDEHATACRLYEESLAIGGTDAPRSEIAGTLGYLGNALLRAGDLDGAYRRLAESLTISHEIGHRRRLAYALEGLSGVVAARQQWERSLRLAGFAIALRERIGAPLWPAGLAALEHRLGPARQQLGPARASECWAAGRALSVGAAIAEALDAPAAAQAGATGRAAVPTAPRSEPDGAPPHPLTQREIEVVRLIARGLTNRQIADALVISEGTAAVHVKHILNKLDLQSRAQVAAWAVRRSVVTDAD